jgi:hypothetical protein
MTASAPPLTFMIVDGGTRWLPEPEPSAQARGGGAAQRRRLAISRNPSVASIWCASPAEESSRRSFKVVKNFKKGWIAKTRGYRRARSGRIVVLTSKLAVLIDITHTCVDDGAPRGLGRKTGQMLAVVLPGVSKPPGIGKRCKLDDTGRRPEELPPRPHPALPRRRSTRRRNNHCDGSRHMAAVKARSTATGDRNCQISLGLFERCERHGLGGGNA